MIRLRRRPSFRRFMLGVLLVAVAYGLLVAWQRIQGGQSSPEVMLLLPDGVGRQDELTRVWVDAAAETGVLLQVGRASQFLRPVWNGDEPRAIILPDTIHRHISPALVTGLDRYVRAGGNLMLVFDAGTLTPEGHYPGSRSLLSPLAGLDYALYKGLGARAIVRQQINATPDTFASLDVPPGKYLPAPQQQALSTYAYGKIAYPHFVTTGAYDGRSLIRSAAPDHLIAGVRRHGRGQVLFVNLPLGYLKSRSDGVLLHGFLRYFADVVVGLPRLTAVPRGVGGMVLNWHVDSNASYAALERIERETTLLREGPFSIHVTAGPDTYRPGDKAGMNLAHDPRARQWMQRFLASKAEIGSHGGWIHNLFGLGVTADNADDYRHYLDWNFASIQRMTGRSVTEYSAPMGNHPQWVTDWLQVHGVLGYYFTGDTGMAPTRTYRDGARSDLTTWAFPITPYGRSGSFEEAATAGISPDEITRWLRGLVEFTDKRQSVRLLYFHPPGADQYLPSLQQMVDHARALGPERFAWYTMSGHARFMLRREQVRWTVNAEAGADVLEVDGKTDLSDLTWLVPKSRYARPQVQSGRAAILERAESWQLVAEPGTQLEVNLPRRRLPATP